MGVFWVGDMPMGHPASPEVVLTHFLSYKYPVLMCRERYIIVCRHVSARVVACGHPQHRAEQSEDHNGGRVL